MWNNSVTALDLLILALACYLLTDAMVNRALPFGVMTWIREHANSDVFHCFYCSSIWAAIIVYVTWQIEPGIVYPFAIGGGAVLLWRYTGASHV